jgi:hypothetical protein
MSNQTNNNKSITDFQLEGEIFDRYPHDIKNKNVPYITWISNLGRCIYEFFTEKQQSYFNAQTPIIDESGYNIIEYYDKNQKSQVAKLHYAVMNLFNNESNKPQLELEVNNKTKTIDHINMNKRDNAIDNLRYLSENQNLDATNIQHYYKEIKLPRHIKILIIKNSMYFDKDEINEINQVPKEQIDNIETIEDLARLFGKEKEDFICEPLIRILNAEGDVFKSNSETKAKEFLEKDVYINYEKISKKALENVFYGGYKVIKELVLNRPREESLKIIKNETTDIKLIEIKKEVTIEGSVIVFENEKTSVELIEIKKEETIEEKIIKKESVIVSNSEKTSVKLIETEKEETNNEKIKPSNSEKSRKKSESTIYAESKKEELQDFMKNNPNVIKDTKALDQEFIINSLINKNARKIFHCDKNIFDKELYQEFIIKYISSTGKKRQKEKIYNDACKEAFLFFEGKNIYVLDELINITLFKVKQKS